MPYGKILKEKVIWDLGNNLRSFGHSKPFHHCLHYRAVPHNKRNFGTAWEIISDDMLDWLQWLSSLHGRTRCTYRLRTLNCRFGWFPSSSFSRRISCTLFLPFGVSSKFLIFLLKGCLYVENRKNLFRIVTIFEHDQKPRIGN